MDVELLTQSEQKARVAEELVAFNGLNLLYIKRELAELLRHIGQESIFAEYTRHDLQHVNEMLKMLDWIIPEHAKQFMTTTDWLMVVLAVYFHDLGMLVTREEYESRHNSSFPAYRESELLTNDQAGKDYGNKVANLGEETAERFLYQEYVREHHAQRIRSWLTNPRSKFLGNAQPVAVAVSELLAPLGETFIDDLGLICESHHLNNLEEVEKYYKVRRRYGNTDAEATNLQYAAVLLRTVDLLHVTRDRTPSIAFRVINPADPKSREEWQKQMAVVAVTPKLGRNRDDNLDESLPRDTIEVHARFSSPEGFFALTRYLRYATKQLDQCHSWIFDSGKKLAIKHEFPWRDIDQSNIEAKGFLAEEFKFTLDQYKILELLTGHTLYNDTRVVLRELTQNAIDAVRLKYADSSGRKTPGAGVVNVHWRSADRMLSVTDDGTGMSQRIIEDNFLMVGSSFYQGAKFRERYPNFSPISRFGIGVLTTFMIADEVDVITSHDDEDQARHLVLRDVHGQYLIELLDKDSEQIPTLIRHSGHGTEVRLKVRASVDIGDIAEVLEQWFVLPGCKLSAQVDDQAPIAIGADSLVSLLNEQLAQMRSLPSGIDSAEQVEVREFKSENVEVAYAVAWSPYFKEWSFLSGNDDNLRLGTCVEGVRVVENSPGFKSNAILAIANLSGPRAPRTNVARSSMEDTSEYRQSLHYIYKAYGDHVRAEVYKLNAERGFSKSWAAYEARILAEPMFGDKFNNQPAKAVSNELLDAEMRMLPFYVVDDGVARQYASLEELAQLPALYTVENALMGNTERLIRSLPSDVTVAKIFEIAGGGLKLPNGPLIDVGLPEIFELFEREWELAEITAEVADRRIDLKWSHRGSVSRWGRISGNRSHPLFKELYGSLYEVSERDRYYAPYSSAPSIMGFFRDVIDRAESTVIPLLPLKVNGLDGMDAVRAKRRTYMLPNRPWQVLFKRLLNDTGSEDAACAISALFLPVVERLVSRGLIDSSDEVRALFIAMPALMPYLDVLLEVASRGFRSFDTSLWTRENIMH